MTEHLFVYGTLMRRAGHVMGRALSRNAEWIGEAVFTGRLYLVASYPGVVASTDPEDEVFGEVFRLTDARFLSQLDDYEGCGRERFPAKWEPVRRRKRDQRRAIGANSVSTETEFAPRAREPTEYVRELHNVRLDDSTSVQAWIYLYNRPVHAFPRIHAGRFLDRD